MKAAFGCLVEAGSTEQIAQGIEPKRFDQARFRRVPPNLPPTVRDARRPGLSFFWGKKSVWRRNGCPGMAAPRVSAIPRRCAYFRHLFAPSAKLERFVPKSGFSSVKVRDRCLPPNRSTLVPLIPARHAAPMLALPFGGLPFPAPIRPAPRRDDVQQAGFVPVAVHQLETLNVTASVVPSRRALGPFDGLHNVIRKSRFHRSSPSFVSIAPIAVQACNNTTHNTTCSSM